MAEWYLFLPQVRLPVADIVELAGVAPSVDVDPAEYARLLGYPRGHQLEGRARELAGWCWSLATMQ